LIIDRSFFATDKAWLTRLELVARAAAGRKNVALQLRVKIGTAAAPRASLLRRGLAVASIARVPLMINGNTADAVALGAAGVHWPEALIPAQEESQPQALIRAASIHSARAARDARAAGADFAIFGPVFPPFSKKLPARGLPALTRICRDVTLPTLALGGITPRRTAHCLAAGAAGVATLSQICSALDPSALIDRYLKSLTKPLPSPRRESRRITHV
jgi:thiamine-phosphate pyrophosphorylase